MEKNELFMKYKGEKVALYGLGIETKKALEELAESYEIVGLLDSFREEGELYGQNILSFSSVVKVGIKLIIVVARPGSCRVIARKIGDECRKKGIALLDIRGRDLLVAPKVSYTFIGSVGTTREKLKGKIKNADVISFDLFDTLVMRQTLFFEDVIECVDCKLKELGISIKDLRRKRLKSEKELSRSMVPTLKEIYHNVLENLENISAVNITAEELADLEWNLDYSLFVPRKEVCNLFREAVKSGKKVYVVSDTYYNKKQLEKILEKCNIVKYAGILASCECRTDKQRQLYNVLKNLEGEMKYLHIGDDSLADIESAERCGISACKLQSGGDLFEAMGNLGLLEYINSLSDRLKVGMFVAKIFNSPFQFEKEDRYLEIKDAYDIGYSLCAPVISDFVLWFQEQLEQEEFRNIWFGARDGYLIKKMYAYLLKVYGRADESVYFLTSRMAAVRAGMQDDDDLRYVDEMKFSGTLEKNLMERFGIDASSISNEKILIHEDGLLRYRNVILENAHREYANYKKYIAGVDIKEGSIAFFDFVAKGTTQMYIQRLTDNPMKGFYFLQLEPEYMKDKGIAVCSFGEKRTSFQDAVFEDYYILETLLTAPHPSVWGFDENGQPIYALETRKDSDIRCFERAQRGILDYFKIYLELCPEAERYVNKELDGIFLKLIHEIRITDDAFLKLVVEDPFFNRMTNMMDVI